MSEREETRDRVVGADGEVPKVLRPGKPCPFCGDKRVERIFGGGCRCMNPACMATSEASR